MPAAANAVMVCRVSSVSSEDEWTARILSFVVCFKIFLKNEKPTLDEVEVAANVIDGIGSTMTTHPAFCSSRGMSSVSSSMPRRRERQRRNGGSE